MPEEIRPCPACECDKIIETFIVTRKDSYAFNGQKPAQYTICGICGLMRLKGGTEFEKRYKNGSYYSRDKGTMQEEFNRIISLPPEKSDNFARIKRINKYLVDTHRTWINIPQELLDIGAGRGVFLYKFLEHHGSINATALEPDPTCCRHMKKILPNVKVINDSIENMPEGKYDFIVMNRSLEHIYDQNKTLKKVKDCLSPYGTLYIEAPSVISYQIEGANSTAFGYGHYYVYSMEALRRLLEKNLFETMFTDITQEPSGKFTLYGFFN